MSDKSSTILFLSARDRDRSARRRQLRDKLRDSKEWSEREAVGLAECGYPVDRIVDLTGFSMETASILVLGVEVVGG